jgi:hypothetical protein
LVEIKVQGQKEPAKVMTKGALYCGDDEGVVIGGGVWCNGDTTPWTKPWKGLTVVFKGKIPGYKHAECEVMAMDRLGADKCRADISGITDILVYGEKSVQKKQKAEEKGVATMTAQEFLDLLDSTNEQTAEEKEKERMDDLLKTGIQSTAFFSAMAAASSGRVSAGLLSGVMYGNNKLRMCVPKGVQVLHEVSADMLATFRTMGGRGKKTKAAHEDTEAASNKKLKATIETA